MEKAKQTANLKWIITEQPLTESSIQEWQDLCDKSELCNASAYYNVVASSRPLTNQSQFLYAKAYQNDQFAAAIGLMRKTISVFGLRFQSIQLISHDHIDLQIIAGQDKLNINLFLASLLTSLRKQIKGWHFFLGRRWYFDEIPDAKFLSPVYVRNTAFFEFDEATSVDQIIAKKMLKNIRRTERKLSGDFSEVQLVVGKSTEEIDSGIKAFITLESSGWKGSAGSAIGCSAELVKFYTENWLCFSHQQTARTFQLICGERTVAACIGFEHKKNLFLHKIAFDESLSTYGPGSILVKNIIEKAINESTINRICFNTCPDWISRWHPQIKPLHAVQGFNSNLGGQTIRIISKIMNSLRLIKRKYINKQPMVVSNGAD